jgi:hypothetical protein
MVTGYFFKRTAEVFFIYSELTILYLAAKHKGKQSGSFCHKPAFPNDILVFRCN